MEPAEHIASGSGSGGPATDTLDQLVEDDRTDLVNTDTREPEADVDTALHNKLSVSLLVTLHRSSHIVFSGT